MPSKRLASLVALTVHYSITTLVVHASRTRVDASYRNYKPSSAVTLSELGKFMISLALALHEVHEQRIKALDTAEARHGLGLGMTPKIRHSLAGVSSKSSERTSEEQHNKETETDGAVSSGRPSVADDDHEELENFLPEFQHSPNIRTSLMERSYLVVRQVFGEGCWKLAIPAMLFTFQSNIRYVGLANLSVLAFQVTEQLKILTTALCSVILLGRRMTLVQWAALSILALGVAVIQLQTMYATSGNTGTEQKDGSIIHLPEMNQVVGLAAVILMCLSSGFASTYFEKCLKTPTRSTPESTSTHAETSQRQVVFDVDADGEETNTKEIAAVDDRPSPSPHTIRNAFPSQEPGLWVRNVQLSMFAFVLSAIMFVFETNKDAFRALGDQVIGSSQWWWDATDGVSSQQDVTSSVAWRPASLLFSDFFEGFTAIAWFIVFLQITGGLLAALVIKHADNIAKNFATSLSILLSFAASVFLFNFEVTLPALSGASMVILATWLFNSGESLKMLWRQFRGSQSPEAQYEMVSPADSSQK